MELLPHQKYYLSKLTDREIQVLLCTVAGNSNKQTSAELFISEKTTKFHLTSIYKKLGCKSRSQLIVKYLYSDNPIVKSITETKIELLSGAVKS